MSGSTTYNLDSLLKKLIQEFDRYLSFAIGIIENDIERKLQKGTLISALTSARVIALQLRDVWGYPQYYDQLLRNRLTEFLDCAVLEANNKCQAVTDRGMPILTVQGLN